MATRVIAVRSPHAPEIHPVITAPKNPPPRKMYTPTMANPCERSRNGMTELMRGINIENPHTDTVVARP
jgi:hypothetical protein